MNRVQVTVNGKGYLVEVDDLSASPLTVRVNGRVYQVDVETGSEGGETAVTPLTQPSTDMTTPGNIIAPMPGNIINIVVKPGEQVSVGQILCSLEAMKMQNAIRSPRQGVIADVAVSEGQVVGYGDLLFTYV